MLAPAIATDRDHVDVRGVETFTDISARGFIWRSQSSVLVVLDRQTE
jgi:hypothetical protein